MWAGGPPPGYFKYKKVKYAIIPETEDDLPKVDLVKNATKSGVEEPERNICSKQPCLWGKVAPFIEAPKFLKKR